jgi:N-formylglutamate amidohydrolase
MRLPVVIHQARLGADTFRVIRPARPLSHAVLIDHDRHLDAYLDRDAARRIAGLWTLAARSPRSLIHLPMRTNRPPAGKAPAGTGLQLDLVLLHHSLQFAPSRWKQVRSRLGPGSPQTVNLPDTDPADTATVDYASRHHQENRDLFQQRLHAETLFMTGSAKVFRETVRHFLDVARNGPTYVPVHPNYPHFCTEFGSNDGTLGDAREIHIEYCGQWNS